jgi:hypothetical protein
LPETSSQSSVSKILKTFWSLRNDGRWQISGMKGIDLKPVPHSDADCFAIEDDIVLVQPATIGTIKSFLGDSIVPIVTHHKGENRLRCIGTGFFVSCSGLLITSAHVVTDPVDRKYGDITELDDLTIHSNELRFGVLIRNNPLFQRPGYQLYPIEWAVFLAERREDPLRIFGLDLKLNSDIAICKVPKKPIGPPHQPLTIVQAGIRGTGIGVGANVAAIGYAGMTEEIMFDEHAMIIGEHNCQLHVTRGNIMERYPDNFQNRTVSTPGPCFALAAKVPGGMSGSPIFDREGIYVHGVISKGLDDETGLAKLGFGSMLAPSMEVPIRALNGSTLKRLQENHDDGMGILHGAGL